MTQGQPPPPFAALPRTSSCSRTSKKITPANTTTYLPSCSSATHDFSSDILSDKSLVVKNKRAGTTSSSSTSTSIQSRIRVSSLLRSFISIISFPLILSRWLNLPTQFSITTPSLGRKVTGTLFGHRRGHVTFTVQNDPKSEPVLRLELAISTSALVKEMSSGLVRIALECEKAPTASATRRRMGLFDEPVWTMYCNGRKCGYAHSRECTDSDWHVLSTVQSVSVGAGVVPEGGGRKISSAATAEGEGELLYMRAKFERVVGSRDSEAFYMMNPDGNGGPELSIFLIRI
ncbi:unnamed protein product [Withania somnifera]